MTSYSQVAISDLKIGDKCKIYLKGMEWTVVQANRNLVTLSSDSIERDFYKDEQTKKVFKLK